MTTTTERLQRRGAVAALAALALLAGCGSAGSEEPGEVDIVVSLPALEFLASELGGPDARVTSITPDGADPHNLELAPSDIALLQSADLVVYLSGIQPAVDEAVSMLSGVEIVDVLEAASADVDSPTQAHPAPSVDHDPHFWLDPPRLAVVGDVLAEALVGLAPESGDEVDTRAQDVRTRLGALDAEFREGLAPCAGDTLVTSHEAFGFLAARYDLIQEGIAGVDPEVEPSPARLREVRELVERTGVRTIYFEARASSRVAERLADELGIATGVLDPLERTGGADYLEVMRANLRALTDGLVCGR